GTLFIDSPVEYENLFLDEKSTLTIEEGGNVERGGSQTIIEGSVENAGELIIRNTSYVAISGSLVNTDTGVLKFGNEIILTGTLDNQGVIYAVEDGNAVITTEGDGSFTGNEPETVETDTFYW
ncbi:MAG: hypothetical protein LUH53_10660, partial [Lachnospiraceae bacterium]|nr:hypothetical protein [Lachnospiraceae bacterium]